MQLPLESQRSIRSDCTIWYFDECDDMMALIDPIPLHPNRFGRWKQSVWARPPTEAGIKANIDESEKEGDRDESEIKLFADWLVSLIRSTHVHRSCISKYS
jgi:hypothetical protein